MKMARRWLILLMICGAVAALFSEMTAEILPEKIPGSSVIEPSGEWRQDGHTLQFICPLPQSEEVQLLLLQSHWPNYQVLVDGQAIFSSARKGLGPYHLLVLPEGRNLCIQFIFETEAGASSIRQSRFVIGNKSGIYHKMVSENLYAVIFASLAAGMAVVSVCMGIYTGLQHATDLSEGLVSLGMYIFCAGVWVLTDSKILMLVTRRTGLVELISFLAFFALPIPLLNFTKKTLPGKERSFGFLQLLFQMMFLLFVVNRWTGFLAEMWIVIAEHCLMAVTIGTVLYNGFREMHRRKSKRLYRVMVGYVVFSICSVLALGFFYRHNDAAYSIAYVIGMLGFIVCLSDAAWTAVFDRVREHANVAMYAQMAYHDMMTGLGNRAAFRRDGEADKIFRDALAYIMVDTNNLKKINDSQGHLQGDTLICTIARCIQQTVGDMGQCYRIGGDEFVIRMRKVSCQHVMEYVQALQNAIEAENAQSDIPISAAIGYAWTDEETKDLSELFRRADDDMYETKKRMKESMK